jgi:hypothetical protein
MVGRKQFGWPAREGLFLFVWGTTDGKVGEQLHVHLTGHHLLELVVLLCSNNLLHFTE